MNLPLFDAVHPSPPLPQAGGGGAWAAGGHPAGAAEPAPSPSPPGCAGDPQAHPAGPPAFDLARHPAVWRASQIGGAARRITASGFEQLDAQLPGGGWPHGVLTELLLPEPGVGELRLLAPALAALAAPAGQALAAASPARTDRPAQRVVQAPGVPRGAGRPAPSGAPAQARHPLPDDSRCVMLFDPPALLSAWALAQCGLSSRHWLVVQGRAGQPRAGPAGAIAPGAPRGANRLAPLLASADLLWALEQSLKSGHLGAALAWLPLNLRADALRRLQLAAQSHDGPVFIFRDALARSQPSPAPLRLLLQPAGVDGLSVRLLKRRGPPPAQPLRLVLPPVLAPHLQAQAELRQLARQLAAARPLPAGAAVGVVAAADGGHAPRRPG